MQRRETPMHADANRPSPANGPPVSATSNGQSRGQPSNEVTPPGPPFVRGGETGDQPAAPQEAEAPEAPLAPEVDKTPAKIWRGAKPPALGDAGASGQPAAAKRPPGKHRQAFLGREVRRSFARAKMRHDWNAPGPEPYQASL